MAHRFRKHYQIEEARALLPQIRQWLGELQQVHRRLQHLDDRIGQMIASGADAGGESVDQQLKFLVARQGIAQEFACRDVQIKDVERGLIDFPSIIAGREVFLCWELGEDDIEFWHELDAGYAGREKLT
jgi:hypothetical protein